MLSIVDGIERGRFQLLHSEIANLEIEGTPDAERRRRLLFMIPRRHRYLLVDRRMLDRALELELMGFTGIDALHIASAESGDADILLTTDDRMLRKASRWGKSLRVIVANPLAFVQDMSGD